MKTKILVTVCLLSFMLCGCTENAKIKKTFRSQDNIDQLIVVSPELKKCADESPLKTLYVYLPKNYDSSKKRYPVIYYLHGYMDDSTQMFSFNKALDQAVKDGTIGEFILVSIDGKNRFLGGFYTDSPVSGNYESYIIKDIVPLIDSHYRTIPDRNSRGIFGYSMGGFGAIRLSLRNPDIFGAAVSVCGSFYKPEDTSRVLSSWQANLPDAIKAYNAAFSSDTTSPVFDGSDADKRRIADWNSGMSDWEDKVRAYLEKPERLNAIAFFYGSQDMWTWLNDGVKELSATMNAQGISHTIKELPIRHVIGFGTVKDEVLPVFAKSLAFEK